MADPTPVPQPKQAKWTPPPLQQPIKISVVRNYDKPTLAKLGLARRD